MSSRCRLRETVLPARAQRSTHLHAAGTSRYSLPFDDLLKNLLGLWISENEGATFWLNMLTELQNRDVRYMFCSDHDAEYRGLR